MPAAPGPGATPRRIHALRWLETALKAVVATLMFAMMALTTADVFGRYVFVAPVRGAYEIVQALLALLLFAALPLVSRDDAHINVDLFDRAIRGQLRWYRRLVILAASAAVVAFIAHRLWLLGDVFAAGNRVMGAIEIPLAPLTYAMAALAMVTIAVLAGMILRHLAAPASSR